MTLPMKTRGVQVCFRRRRKTKSFGNPEKAKAENSGRLGDCGCSIKKILNTQNSHGGVNG